MTKMHKEPQRAATHASACRADQLGFWHRKLAFEPEDTTLGVRCMYGRVLIVDEARQIGRYTEVAAVGISR